MLKRVREKLKAMPLIRTAVYVSVLIHVILISVHFSPDLKKMADSMPVLDVSLVMPKPIANRKKPMCWRKPIWIEAATPTKTEKCNPH